MTTDTPRPGRLRRPAAVLAGCIGASFVVWLPSLWAGFTGDDLEGVLRAVGGGAVRAGLGPAVQLRPLSDLSLRLDHAVAGLDASVFHLTNVVLHGVVAALVAVLADRLWDAGVRRRGGAAALPRWAPGGLAAAVFLVMPSHSEAVAWVGGRGDLLVAVGTLASLLCWWSATGPDRTDRRWLAGSLAALALALLAKETAATWPLVLSAFEVARTWSDGNGPRARRVRRAAARPWPAYALVAVWFAARWVRLGTPLGSYGGGSLTAGGPVAVVRRSASVVVRAFVPGMPVWGWVVAGVAAIALGAAVAAAARRPEGAAALRSWPVAFLPVAVVLAALPGAALGASATGPLGERLAYVPSAFAAVLLAWLLLVVVARWPAAGWSSVAAVLTVGLVLAVMAQVRWVLAGALADELFDSAAALPRDRPALVLDEPDEREGAYVALNALPAALALRHGWTDLTAVWSAATYAQRADGKVAVVAGPGPRTWTVRLLGRDARFLEVFPRAASAQRAAVDVERLDRRTVRVTLGPPPPGAPAERVWAVSEGRLAPAPAARGGG